MWNTYPCSRVQSKHEACTYAPVEYGVWWEGTLSWHLIHDQPTFCAILAHQTTPEASSTTCDLQSSRMIRGGSGMSCCCQHRTMLRRRTSRTQQLGPASSCDVVERKQLQGVSGGVQRGPLLAQAHVNSRLGLRPDIHLHILVERISWRITVSPSTKSLACSSKAEPHASLQLAWIIQHGRGSPLGAALDQNWRCENAPPARYNDATETGGWACRRLTAPSRLAPVVDSGILKLSRFQTYLRRRSNSTSSGESTAGRFPEP